MKHLLFITTLMVCTLQNCLSCSCNHYSFEEAIEWADEIFMGRVIETREVEYEIDSKGQKFTRIWSAIIEVNKKWKGNNERFIEIFQANTSCDATLNLSNHEVIIYAKKSDILYFDTIRTYHALSTWMCSRSHTLNSFRFNEGLEADDRKKLDVKFPTPIKLSKFQLRYRWLFASILIVFLSLYTRRIFRNQSS